MESGVTILKNDSYLLSLYRDLPLPGFSVSWLGNRNAFQAGDVATIVIRAFGESPNGTEFIKGGRYGANFSLSVNGKKGDSSYVSSVVSCTEGDPNHWNITFIPIRAGDFVAVVTEENSGLADSSLPYTVTTGALYPPASVASWMNLEDEFVAGEKARILILPKDTFGNNISSITEEGSSSTFKLSSSKEDGSAAHLLNFTYTGWDGLGRLGIEFVPITAGSLSLHVVSGNQSLTGSPLSFRVRPGSLDIKMCEGKWKYETNAIKIFSRLEFLIYQQDQYGNLVPGFYQFDAGVVQKETNLSIPIADLSFQETGGGVQLLSFLVIEPGSFMLRVFDAEKNWSISNTSYEYFVFVGYCDGVNSVVNGSGLISSVAGRMSYFSVYLEDMFHNPSPVEARILTVKILRKNDSTSIRPAIFPQRDFQGSTTESSAFNVIYVPEKSGSYDIWIFCGNIPLNGGHAYTSNATPGMVDSSKSTVVKFGPRTRELVRNDVKVQLLDSFSNPITSQEAKLSFNLVNSSSFLRWNFSDLGGGLYVGHYTARDLGTYNICVSYENSQLSPCPLVVNVYNSEYFPDAKNDSISVWEDESVAFDATRNDYFSGNQLRVTYSLMPMHGSLIQKGQLFRYTPYKGFFGDDSFSYTLSDANDNAATGSVSISVLCKPPQFISLPFQLQVTEDVIGPRFGGFHGFEIKHSNKMENISVTIRAKSGSIFLAPMPIHLCPMLAGEVNVAKGGQTGRDLTISGNVDAVNSALDSIKYLGDEDFYGSDAISLSAVNKNGVRDARVAVRVRPVNDPPFIRVPKFVILEKEPTEGVPIFDRRSSSPFEFFIGDPDLHNFPENRSHFVVTLSLELSDGILIGRLPAHLIGTVELKIKNSHQWQHLQAFVTISNHFVIKGRAIRFRASVDDCNDAIRRLLYQGTGRASVLTINVNDMGNYGCCSECGERISIPLQAEATVNLIRRRPVNSISAHLLGAAVVVEFITLLLLGGALLFYICKCTNLLYRDRTPPSATDTGVAATTGFLVTSNRSSLRYERERRCLDCMQEHVRGYSSGETFLVS
ncbi:unnamed protein product [Spirodela intermedia]|uniref:GEX2 N-terminal Ig-like domain-containing protein n=1 Tax=Spirodela intermedia TaxID=51605 RepID=A0A7I8LH68_SPIIN|nr:unnamed protein product [Spirodela intermedia]